MRSAALAVLAALAGLTLLEWTARKWIVRAGDALDRSLPLLRADAALGWRQRENLNTNFLGLSLRTDVRGSRNPVPPASGSPLVIMMGPSSAFGWGVPEEATYSRRLEAALRERFPREAPSVYNAGQIGFSSWQGLRLYKDELRALNARVVVAAYGANDVDRHRFFFGSPLPDSIALPPRLPRAVLRLQNAVGRLRAPALARRRLSGALGRWSCRSAAAGMPPLRVPPEEFAVNMDGLVLAARAGGARPVLLTTPFRLPDSPPGTIDPGGCGAAYAKASALARAGRCIEAERALKEARAGEPIRLAADLRAYNEAVRGLARRRSVLLVDAERLLPGARARLFVDPIHPSIEGHAIIADALADIIGRIP